ncbi:MAG: hypothetical protein R3D56_03390 [Paracoccaceae bacterium]
MKHFSRYKTAANGPISLARAGYWLGRAEQAAGRAGDAQAAYAEAARYQTAFYGLLAAEKAGLPLSPRFLGGEAYPGCRTLPFAGSSAFKAWPASMQAGEHQLAARFFLHLAEGLSGEDIGRTFKMALEANEPYIGVVLAKAAADKGVIWPSVTSACGPRSPEPAGADRTDARIARRESEFNPGGRRGRGFGFPMQVMPETGKMMAAKVGLGYDRGKLGRD